MIVKKTELILLVTIFAIILTTLIYIFPIKYAQLWLTLEIIIIPTIYLVGYELLIHKQKKAFNENISILNDVIEKQEKVIFKLKLKK